MVSFKWKGTRYTTENRVIDALMAVPVALFLVLMAIIVIGSTVALVSTALMFVSGLIVIAMVTAVARSLIGPTRRR